MTQNDRLLKLFLDSNTQLNKCEFIIPPIAKCRICNPTTQYKNIDEIKLNLKEALKIIQYQDYSIFAENLLYNDLLFDLLDICLDYTLLNLKCYIPYISDTNLWNKINTYYYKFKNKNCNLQIMVYYEDKVSNLSINDFINKNYIQFYVNLTSKNIHDQISEFENWKKFTKECNLNYLFPIYIEDKFSKRSQEIKDYKNFLFYLFKEYDNSNKVYDLFKQNIKCNLYDTLHINLIQNLKIQLCNQFTEQEFCIGTLSPLTANNVEILLTSLNTRQETNPKCCHCLLHDFCMPKCLYEQYTTMTEIYHPNEQQCAFNIEKYFYLINLFYTNNLKIPNISEKTILDIMELQEYKDVNKNE